MVTLTGSSLLRRYFHTRRPSLLRWGQYLTTCMMVETMAAGHTHTHTHLVYSIVSVPFLWAVLGCLPALVVTNLTTKTQSHLPSPFLLPSLTTRMGFPFLQLLASEPFSLLMGAPQFFAIALWGGVGRRCRGGGVGE